jgi:hypothetical protein
MPYLIQAMFIATLLLIGACEKEGPMERAGAEVDEAVEETGDALEQATDR